MEQSVTINGTIYVISDTEWVTVKRYCELYGIQNVTTVLNWIIRGIIPTGDYITVPELNNIKLIRVKQYQEWYPPVTNQENEERPVPPRGGHKKSSVATD